MRTLLGFVQGKCPISLPPGNSFNLGGRKGLFDFFFFFEALLFTISQVSSPIVFSSCPDPTYLLPNLPSPHVSPALHSSVSGLSTCPFQSFVKLLLGFCNPTCEINHSGSVRSVEFLSGNVLGVSARD